MIDIYCFTGSGNSLAVSRQLAGLLSDKCRTNMIKGLVDCDIIEPDADCVGIIFPVYAWSMPKIVRRFVRRLSIPHGTYVFALYTHAGAPGAAGIHLDQMLKVKNYGLNAGFDLKMPSNYTPFGIASEEKNKKVLAEAGDKIQRIASVINERRNNRIDRTKFFWPLGKIMSSLFMSQINGKQVKFEENGKCISCGTCVKICPNQNINLSEGKPVWGRNCELCMACLHWCPVKAIEYGRNSRNGRRYHHPAITVYDMVPKDRRDDT